MIVVPKLYRLQFKLTRKTKTFYLPHSAFAHSFEAADTVVSGDRMCGIPTESKHSPHV